ncbi:DUF2971 domain-containing protein [Brevundimonas viscosa]|nr:DUF2971 domain-containing protein [Brevundimonas viscosa]
MDDIDEQLAGLFFPYATKKQNDVRSGKTRFVHYTTAEAAVRIIQNREVWMRRTTTMNDYMEVEYGFECLNAAYKSEAATKMKTALDEEFPGTCDELEKRFNLWLPAFRGETYVTCISEHDTNEDDIGRLSMWRAYGSTAGVAIVLNSTAFATASDAIRAYTSPVAYLSNAQFEREFGLISDNIANSRELWRHLGQESVIDAVFQMMRFSTVCTKHPGFHEEREWRIIHTPALEATDRLPSNVEVVRGVPQCVHKIPLRNYPEEGFVGAEVPELIDRIIIGPAVDAWSMRDAFVRLLEGAGTEDARSRVVISDIPLR